MSLREEFVVLARAEGSNISELCRRFGISRKCGYKWIGRMARDEAGDESGDGSREVSSRRVLADRSRRPHRSPMQTASAMELLVVQAREDHPAWGARKLRRVLINQGRAAAELPAPSTMGRILQRRGLIDPSGAESARHRAAVRFQKEHPNEMWQMDFKGHVPMLDGKRCHPLTVLDDHSRYALAVRACADEQTTTVRQALIQLFERYGQPRRMLCDNGSPWGNSGIDPPYTTLSVWLMRHGVGVTHGRACHPQTQGKDERFHRTLKAELLARQVLRDLEDSQNRFEHFRHEYNHLRPHEALGMDCPASRYRPSEKSYTPDPAPPPFDRDHQVRKVDVNGNIQFKGRRFKISKAFVGQQVGLREHAQIDGLLNVMFCCQQIGQIDLRCNDRHGHQEPPTMQCVPTSPPRLACCADPPVATLPTARHSTEKSVTHVSEHVSPLTPV